MVALLNTIPARNTPAAYRVVDSGEETEVSTRTSSLAICATSSEKEASKAH